MDVLYVASPTNQIPQQYSEDAHDCLLPDPYLLTIHDHPILTFHAILRRWNSALKGPKIIQYNLMLYIFCAVVFRTRFISNHYTKLAFTILHVSTSYCSHHQEATLL
jgi:hypothetical protein